MHHSARRLSLLLIFLGGAVSLLQAQNFYGAGIQEIRINLPQPTWDQMLDSMKKVNPEARLTGHAVINGTRYDSVGMRYKGNSSYFRSRNETYKKLPINLKLDYRIKTQKLPGNHTTVKLSNGFLDPSFIRDPLAYYAIRNYMPAPQCNFAKVFLNGKFHGLYVNSESVDEHFILKHFGTEGGHLVKCDPDNWKRVKSQSGCPKGENASLSYLNDSPGCYDAFYEVDDPAAWKPLLNLIKVLNKTPDKIETVLDVDQTLWMLALNNAIVNLDSYNGSLAHNYYLWFDTTGVAHPIIWDLNMAFGGWRRNFSFEEMKDEELIQYSPLAEFENKKRPLISQLLKNPLYRKIYLAHLRTIVNEQMKDNQLLKKGVALAKEIEGVVKDDPNKLYTFENFKQAFDQPMVQGPDRVIGLRTLLEKRGQWLSKHALLTKTQPAIAEVQAVAEGAKHRVTARLTNAKGGWLFYRKDKMFAFRRMPMTDDGANGDAAAGDGIFTALVDSAEIAHYYVAAENEETAITHPERASYEFLRLSGGGD
jgi:hypothetical protein